MTAFHGTPAAARPRQRRNITPTALSLAATAVAALLSLPSPSYALDMAGKRPGPSGFLWTHPYYQCLANYYVAPTGNDANPGSAAQPWLTLQHANNALPTNGSAAGTCINVEPGTYTAGVNITAGGNYASSTGYVTYRCAALDKCKVKTIGNAFSLIGAPGPNYVIIDGFDMVGNSQQFPDGATYGVGVVINTHWGLPQGTPSSHHVWILNNIIHGFGQAGIGTNEADWMFVMHNRTYNNANVTCDAQGSGIGLVVAKATPNYTLTADDQIYAPFHQVVGWNVSYNNILTQCGNASAPYDTDGNGIIIDTFNGAGIDNVTYPNQTLVTNNVTYNNGGKGIQVFRSGYVTVANNTAYDNNLDPWNPGFPRGEINNLGGWSNTYTSNVVLALPAASPSDPRCKGADYDIQPAPCPLMANVSYLDGNLTGINNTGETWLNNINIGGNPPWGWGPQGNAILNQAANAFNCTSNKCEVNPLLTDLEQFNFSLQSTSPAIGYGIVLLDIIPEAVDAGACYHEVPFCS
jgi:parallel beta-helix repeat protein